VPINCLKVRRGKERRYSKKREKTLLPLGGSVFVGGKLSPGQGVEGGGEVLRKGRGRREKVAGLIMTASSSYEQRKENPLIGRGERGKRFHQRGG